MRHLRSRVRPRAALVALAALAALETLGAAAHAQLDPNDAPVSLGPLGGSAVSLAIDPSDPDVVLFVKYTQGLFRSEDGGASGVHFGTGYSSGIRDLQADPQDPSRLYALDGHGILTSTDFGATWDPLNLSSNEPLKDFALAPTGDDMLAADAFNIYHSPDGGSTWSVADSTVPFAGTVFGLVEYAPTDASIAYHGQNHGVRRSTNGGASFSNPGAFDVWVQALTVSPTDADTVYVGTPFNGVQRSTNGGANFTVVGTDLTQSDNGEFFVWEGTRLWYALLDGVVYTDNGGASWTASTGFPDNTPIPIAMAIDTLGNRYLGTEGGGLNDQSGGGLYRMLAGPVSTWTHIGFLEVGINETLIAGPGGKRLVGLGSGLYAADPGGNVLTPTDYVFDIGIDTRAMTFDPTDPGRWITGGVGAFFDNAQVVVHTNDTTNYVKTYEQLGAGILQDLEFDPSNPNRLLGGIFPGSFGNEAIILSNDAGNTWIDVAGTAGWATRDIAFSPVQPGFVMQLSDNSQWSRSVNGGATWIPLQPAWPASGSAVLLAFDPFVAGTLYRGETGGGLWRSTNTGNNWTQLGVDLNASSHLVLNPDVPGMLWVGTADGEVLVSMDRGDTWTLAWDVPLSAVASGMSLDTLDGTLFVGTTAAGPGSAAASAWELPHASPFVRVGGASPGTGGFAPRHFPAGGFSAIGNGSFAFAGDRVVGGGAVFLAIGVQEFAVPLYGGTLITALPLIVLGDVAGGTPNAPGAGSFAIPFGIPNDVTLVGATLVTQYFVFDPGAADPSQVALSDGLRTRLLP